MSDERCADVLARRLFDAGCRYAFGMPGGEVLTLIDALERAGIRFVLVKHENAGGFMAEGTWHRTGAPGILVATVGPGAMNGVNSVANADQDRVPLIVLTGCIDAAETETYTHQVLDHRAVFAPMTRAQFTLSAGAAHVIADKAVRIATEGRPGPVHIDVPISVADASPGPSPYLPDYSPPLPLAPAPSAALNAARAALASARRPLVVAGLDAVNEGAAASVAAFCERFGAPLITTYKAKGLLPEDHPLALGGAGLSPKADKLLLPLVGKADVVLAIGYDPIEMRAGWQDPWDPSRQTVIDISAAPNRHGMHRASYDILGGCGESLAALTEGLVPGETWSDGEIAETRAGLAQAFPVDEPWGPAAVIAETRATMPPDTLVTADSGAHRILLSQMWRCVEPKGLMQSSGLCTMGCALPLAMGAKLADPDRPVVAFMGDAGFLMVAGELASAAELGLGVVAVVFVDASLALIEMKQRSRQMTNRGVDFARHDHAAIARAFGGHGETVRDRTGLRAALNAAQSRPGFTLIAAEIDRGAYDGRL
ncbi:MAG: thiamine pyrophosphate-binding protein [Rhodobacteraceae bacterium]|nr:thiamine pyrophosphate-binding protein [Paracoccaceae bacterium]